VLPTLGSSTRAQDVTPAHLRAMVDKLTAAGQSGSSVRGAIVATSALFRHAVRRGVVATNPVRLLERGDRPSGKRRTEPRYLDRAAIDKLLAELGNEMRPVAAVMAFAGLRVSEALALRWRDVNLDDGMLDVPGTKTEASSQPAPLTADLVAERRAHRRRAGAKSLPNVRAEALVFSHDRRKVFGAVYAAGDRAKLNPDGLPRVSCHELRHSCAGLLFSAGVSAPKVAAILRHSDVRVTLSTYAELVETDRANLRGDLETAYRACV
jgi:integrase